MGERGQKHCYDQAFQWVEKRIHPPFRGGVLNAPPTPGERGVGMQDGELG